MANSDDRIFKVSFDAVMAEEDQGAEKVTTPYSQYLSPLGDKVTSLFSQAKRERLEDENRWLADLRQYKGVYSSEEQGRIDPNRSRAFMRMTRTKVKALDARVCDILFPGNENNWDIAATPVPNINMDEGAAIVQQQSQQLGRELSQEEILYLIKQHSDAKMDRMRRKIADQLAEFCYESQMKKVIHSGHLYGDGIFKGPLVKQKKNRNWNLLGDGSWAIQETVVDQVYGEFVPVWSFYPDNSATTIDSCQYIFQRHVMNKTQVAKLMDQVGFSKYRDAIDSYLRAYPDGDSQRYHWEESLRSLGAADEDGPTQSTSRYEKYEVLEFWGYLTVDELVEAGVEVPEELRGEIELAANVWTMGPLVIKANVSPIDAVTFPYYIYSYDKDETGFFSEGVAAVMRDPQQVYNASVRALLDNASVSAGPIMETNLDLIAADEDPNDIHAFRNIQRSGQGADATAPALRVYNINSHTNELIALSELFKTVSDEVTGIPRYAYGETSQLSGAGRTSTGLSMILGNVNIGVKDLVKTFDDNVTSRFIRSLYYYNMEFDPDPSIKGDYNVVAKGITSLIAKEVRLEHLVNALNVLSQPQLAPYIEWKNYLEEFLKAMDLSNEGLLKSKEQVQVEMAQAAAEAERLRQEEREDQRFKLLQSTSKDTQDLANAGVIQ